LYKILRCAIICSDYEELIFHVLVRQLQDGFGILVLGLFSSVSRHEQIWPTAHTFQVLSGFLIGGHMPRRYSDAFGVLPEQLKMEGAFNGFVDIDAKFHIDPHLLAVTLHPLAVIETPSAHGLDCPQTWR
jgi:hypothetical protein